jgi:hypothetical protein
VEGRREKVEGGRWKVDGLRGFRGSRSLRGSGGLRRPNVQG